MNPLFPNISTGILCENDLTAMRTLQSTTRRTSYNWIYVEGDAAGSRYIPGRIPNKSGDTAAFLGVAIREAINNKSWSNRMTSSRPNLLMGNFLLGGDFKKALQMHLSLRHERIPIIPDKNIDAVMACTCGIDDLPIWNCTCTVYGDTVWIRDLAGASL